MYYRSRVNMDGDEMAIVGTAGCDIKIVAKYFWHGPKVFQC